MWYNKGGVVTEWISNRTWQTSNTETGSGYRTNTRNRLHWKTQAPSFNWDRYIEYQKSRVRSKVEYVFLIIKRLFGYRKVRYRGLKKNRTHAFILGTCANLFMLAQSGWRMGCEVA